MTTLMRKKTGKFKIHTALVEDFKETAYFLSGRFGEKFVVASKLYIYPEAKGTASSVEFSWNQVLNHEEKVGDIVGFFHTHPSECPRISYRDQETMEQWVQCFGKDLICVIECDGKIRIWLFRRKDMPKELTIREDLGNYIVARV